MSLNTDGKFIKRIANRNHYQYNRRGYTIDIELQGTIIIHKRGYNIWTTTFFWPLDLL